MHGETLGNDRSVEGVTPAVPGRNATGGDAGARSLTQKANYLILALALFMLAGFSAKWGELVLTMGDRTGGSFSSTAISTTLAVVSAGARLLSPVVFVLGLIALFRAPNRKLESWTWKLVALLIVGMGLPGTLFFGAGQYGSIVAPFLVAAGVSIWFRKWWSYRILYVVMAIVLIVMFGGVLRRFGALESSQWFEFILFAAKRVFLTTLTFAALIVAVKTGLSRTGGLQLRSTSSSVPTSGPLSKSSRIARALGETAAMAVVCVIGVFLVQIFLNRAFAPQLIPGTPCQGGIDLVDDYRGVDLRCQRPAELILYDQPMCRFHADNLEQMLEDGIAAFESDTKLRNEVLGMIDANTTLEAANNGPHTGFYDNGQKLSEGNLKNGLETGKWTWWHPNGEVQAEGKMKKGLAHGKFVFYHPNSRIASRGEFRNGEMHKSWTAWHDNGEKHSQGAYDNGVRVGKWRIWDSSGALDEELSGHYRNGERVRGL